MGPSPAPARAIFYRLPVLQVFHPDAVCFRVPTGQMIRMEETVPRPREDGAEGATTPETLRQKDHAGMAALESDGTSRPPTR